MLRADQLSGRQRRVLDGVTAGKSNAVIADELGITLDEVKWHVSELLGEAGFASRRELAEWWRRETSPRVALFILPRRIVAHPTAGFIARVVVVFAVAAAISGGIVIAATRKTHEAVVVTPGAPEKLAYVQDGDIWVSVLPDGVAERITHAAADDRAGNTVYARPRWSPTGRWLTFMKGKQLGVMRDDGSRVRLYDTGWIAWSPVSDRLALVEHTTNGSLTLAGTLVVENADGSGRRVVAQWHGSSGEDGGLSDPVWSGDGAAIAYVEERAVSSTPALRTYAGIWSVAADGGGQASEALSAGKPPGDGFGLLAWTRFDALLFYRMPAFTADLADGVVVEELRVGSGPQPIVHEFAPHALQMLLGLEFWSLAPSGRLAAFTSGGGRETWTNKRIAVASPLNATLADVTRADMAAMEPAWSRGGERIAYVAAPDAGTSVSGGDAAKAAMAQRKIWVMETDGSNQRQLTDDPAYRDEYPRWSADGSRIYFMRLDAQDRWSLWVTDADGGDLRELIGGLSPNIMGSTAPVWFDYYGLISWSSVLDYWPATAR